MKNMSAEISELYQLKRLIGRYSGETEANREKASTSLLIFKARALELVRNILNSEAVNKILDKQIDEVETTNLIELIEIAIEKAQSTTKMMLMENSETNYIQDLVSRALWSGKDIKVMTVAFVTLFSIVVALTTYGAITVFNKTSKASEILLGADKNLKDAQAVLDRAQQLKESAFQKIKDVDAELTNMRESLDQLKAEQLRKIDQYEKEMVLVKTHYEGYVNNIMGEFKIESEKSISKIKNMPEDFEKKYFEPLEKNSEIIKNKLETLNKGIAKSDEINSSNLDSVIGLTHQLSTISGKFNKKIENNDINLNEIDFKINTLKNKIDVDETKLGSFETIMGMLDDFKKDYKISKTRLEDLKKDANIINTLAGDLGRKSNDVYERIKVAMELSNENIKNSFLRVLDSNLWIKVIFTFVIVMSICIVANFIRIERKIKYINK